MAFWIWGQRAPTLLGVLMTAHRQYDCAMAPTLYTLIYKRPLIQCLTKNYLQNVWLTAFLFLWLTSFLSNRTQAVKVNGQLSNNGDVISSIPQRSVYIWCPHQQHHSHGLCQNKPNTQMILFKRKYSGQDVLHLYPTIPRILLLRLALIRGYL